MGVDARADHQFDAGGYHRLHQYADDAHVFPGFARVQHDGIERRVQFLAVAYTDANHSRLGFVRQVGRLNLDDDRIAHICRGRGGAGLIVDQVLCDDRNTIGGEHRLRLALGQRIVRRVLDQLRGAGRRLRAGTPRENARAAAAAIVAPMPCGNAAKAAVHRAEHRDVRVAPRLPAWPVPAANRRPRRCR